MTTVTSTVRRGRTRPPGPGALPAPGRRAGRPDRDPGASPGRPPAVGAHLQPPEAGQPGHRAPDLPAARGSRLPRGPAPVRALRQQHRRPARPVTLGVPSLVRQGGGPGVRRPCLGAAGPGQRQGPGPFRARDRRPRALPCPAVEPDPGPRQPGVGLGQRDLRPARPGTRRSCTSWPVDRWRPASRSAPRSCW